MTEISYERMTVITSSFSTVGARGKITWLLGKPPGLAQGTAYGLALRHAAEYASTP